MAIPGMMRRMPNAVCVCIDNYEDGKIGGKLYHMFSRDPQYFSDVTDILKYMGTLMDEIKYPEATIKARSFKKTEQETNTNIDARQKKYEIEDLLQKSGSIASCIVTVSSRVNASWQGNIYWIENDESAGYSSEIEFISLIDETLSGNQMN